MSGAHVSFQSLRIALRNSEYRRFRAKHRSNRCAEILGFAPDGNTLIGWWEGSEELQRFEPDALDWQQITTYV